MLVHVAVDWNTTLPLLQREHHRGLAPADGGGMVVGTRAILRGPQLLEEARVVAAVGGVL